MMDLIKWVKIPVVRDLLNSPEMELWLRMRDADTRRRAIKETTAMLKAASNLSEALKGGEHD